MSKQSYPWLSLTVALASCLASAENLRLGAKEMSGVSDISPESHAAVESASQSTLASCGSLGPSTDHTAIANIAAQIERPTNAAQLLQNLHLAYGKSWLLQPGFFDDATLLKFFAGVKVVWGRPQPITTSDTTMRGMDVSMDSDVFQNATIHFVRRCWQEVKHEPAKGNVLDHLVHSGRVVLRVDNVPGFTVGVVRSVFGQETRYFNDLGITDHGPTFVPMDKGSLIYEDTGLETNATAALWRNRVSFTVKLVVTPTQLEDRLRQERKVSDTDSIQSIEIEQTER